MSRYEIQNKSLTITVGFDKGLQTFFARVTDADMPAGEEELLWVGTSPKELPTVATLQQAVAGYWTLDEETCTQLCHDRDTQGRVKEKHTMSTTSSYLGTCSYSPEDDKLRFYPFHRLDAETYARVKAVGYSWAPKQGCFYAVWGPGRADLVLELAGQIDDEDTSLVDRAEERAERFEEYSDKRGQESQAAHKRAEQIMQGIPLGQPILVGHHSERRARKDAERIEDGLRKAVDLWQTSQYWQERAKGALRHAKYKGRPDVRARRIKGLEADLRKQEKNRKEAEHYMTLWSDIREWNADEDMKRAKYIANFDHIHLPEGHAWGWSIWAALDKGTCTPAEARDYSIARHKAYLPHCQRWIDHLTLRLEYERAMLAGDGGTVADQTTPEKGGAVRCWVCRHTSEWLTIAKVNKVSVTVHDNWGNGGRNFSRLVPLTDLKGVMTVAEVTAKREAGLLKDNAPGTGFYVLDAPPPPPKPAPTPEAAPFDVEAARAALKAGIQVGSAPELFPTPPALADRMVALANVQPGEKVLEPSAGTGRLVEALLRVPLFASHLDSFIQAIEHNQPLAQALAAKRYPRINVTCHDFLAYDPPADNAHKFDVVVMNPPFADQCAHVTHATRFLKSGGRLVAIMSAAITYRQDKTYQQFCQLLATMNPVVEPLPDETFQEEGTSVKTCLLALTVPLTAYP